MKKDLTFLGIETSCDETAASVVREDEKGNVKILSNVVSSQVDEHLKFGGWYRKQPQDLMLKKLILL